MSETVTAAELAKMAGKTRRWISDLANKEDWPHLVIKGRGKPRKEFHIDKLPEEYRLSYYKSNSRGREARGDKSDTLLYKNPPAVETPRTITDETGPPVLTPRQMDDALAKADLVQLYKKHVDSAPWGKREPARDEFMAAYNSGEGYPRIYVALGPVSWKTIEGWKRTAKASDILHLADKRGAYRRGKRSLSEEQKKILLRCSLNPNRPKIAEVIRVARAVMKTKGLHNGFSDATYRRWLEDWKANNYHIWIFSREGAKAWNDKCAPYIERDYSLIEVGDVAVADGHVLNFEILNPWTGKPKRMTLIAWLDMKSAYPLGWEIMPTENTQAIASALRRSILRLGKFPKVAYLDNGKAFGARFFNGVDFEETGISGLFARLNIQTIFAWPYHGQSKTVERFFGTFGELERWAPTYVGSSIDKKPPRLNRGEKLHRKVYDKLMGGGCITMEQAHRAIASWFDLYVQRPQRGHLDGRTPLEVFIEGKGPGVDAADLRFLMMSMEIRHVRRNGISFLGQNYYSPELYGRKHPVLVRYDLQDRSSVLVFTRDGDYLCEAQATEKVHPAAHALGDESDQKKLADQIELKKRLEKDASVYAREFLEQEVIPEHRRQMESMGIDPDSNGIASAAPRNDKKLIPISKGDEERILAELEELKALNADMPAEAEEDEYIPEIVDESTEIWAKLADMPEMDRYEKLLELDVRGWLIPAQWRAFMKYYEQTDQYARHREYFEDHRGRVVMMYQLEGAGQEASERGTDV